jgi:FkbM family methyltransferase
MFSIFKRLLIRLLEQRGYCLSFGEPATFAGILSAFNSRTNDFFFVQIGAYDGRESDPIHASIRRHHWKGVLVEPQPDAFERLKRNYEGCPGLIFENVAIADRKCSRPFYKLKDSHARLFHADHGTLSSFSAEHILKHLSEPVDAGQALDAIQIPCIALSDLLDRHGVEKIDLLQIDAEGYDFEIIKTVPFDKVSPQIIHFEHAHLTTTAKGECIQLLVAHNYKLVVGAYDVTAFRSQWLYD